MSFEKTEEPNLHIVLDVLKLALLMYNLNVDFDFDSDQNTETLLNTIDANTLTGLSDLRKQLLIEICKTSPKGKLLHFYDNKNNGMQSAITISHTHKRICIIFRGSTTKQDWLYNLKFNKTNIGRDIYVHTGFYRQLTDNDYCNNIINDVKNLSHIYKNYEIYISGHSMGGALATIFGYKLSRQISDNVTIITFASPRIGNYTWYEKFNVIPNLRLYRVTNNRDIVTTIPYFKYYHVGNSMLLKKNDMIFKIYYQANDFFYNNICSSFSIYDHDIENYYRKIKYILTTFK